uniref:Uncharacterized protein n=1 Tax=Plectus sambesii TaxID=2011161 RepID=A0A914V0M1_9BILA
MWRSFIFLFLFIWSVGGIDHRSGNEEEEPSDDVSGTYLVISGESHSWYGGETSNTDARPESSSERRADKSEPISAEYIPEENPFRRRGKFFVSGDCTFVPPRESELDNKLKQDHYVKKVSIGGDITSIGPDLPSIGGDLQSIGGDLPSIGPDLLSLTAYE